MVLREVITLKGIRSYLISEGTEIYVNQNYELYFNGNLLSTKVLESGYMLFNGNLIFLSGSSTKVNNEVFENLSFVGNSADIDTNTIIFSGDFKLNYPNFTNSYYLYELSSKARTFICEFQNLFYFFRHRKYFFFSDRYKIQTLTLSSTHPQWQFDLATLGESVNDSGEKFKYEVEKFIGVVGNSLLVLLRQKEILVFDIETGTVTQRLKTIDSFLGETVIDSSSTDKLPFFMTNYFIQSESGIIYALFLDILYEITKEGDSFKTKVFGLKSEMEKMNINSSQISRNTFYFENKIYFLEQELGRFGILNVESKNIEYVSEVIEIKGEGLGFDKLKEIQANAEKVYVLDKANTLHIFQKT